MAMLSVVIRRYAPLVALALLALGLLLWLAAGPAAAQATIDYDTDDDTLIEIDTAAKLTAIRYDLNGDGTVDNSGDQTNYDMGFPTPLGTQCDDPATGGTTETCTGYELTSDIALTAAWTPIGTSTSVAYNTTFDGQGHTISGLNISVSANAGVFAWLGASGVVRNVGVLAPSITSAGAGSSVGGLVGYAAAGSAIETSYVSGGSITMGNGLMRIGGLAGYTAGAVRASWASATLNRAATCSNCNSSQVGGLVGRQDDASGLTPGSITASYAAGPNSVDTTGLSGTLLGGLVGRVTGNAPVITNSYCDSSVMVVTNCIGGRDVPASAATASADTATTSELQTPTGYTGIYSHWNLDLDADKVPDYLWNFGGSTAYPTLNTPAQRAAATPAATDYDSDDDGLIEISTAAQLNAVRWDLDGDGDPASAAHVYSTAFGGRTHTANATTGLMGCPAADGCAGYELTASLNLTADYPAWSTIAGDFTAVFDGKGYAIIGMNIPAATLGGLFSSLGSGGVLRNVGLLHPVIVSAGASDNIGALVGHIQAGGSVDTSYVRGGGITVSGASVRAGGLAGQNSGRIRASYATAAVTAAGDPTEPRLGGLVGYGLGGQIIASYAAGRVTPGAGTGVHAGGLVGRSDGAADTITDSLCDSSVLVALNCIGARVNGSTAPAVAYPPDNLQQFTDYEGLYANWNIDLSDPADGVGDDPWDFGTERHYPLLKVDQDGDGRATCREFRGQPCYRAPTPPPYNPAHDHPEIYTNPRHEMSTSCEVRTTGTGDDAITTSTLTFDLGDYTRPLTLALSLWDGTHFRSLQSQNIAMPELRQEGQTATVEVVTDPAQTRFRLDSQYGLNLVLGYADCHTDDPEE